jgi:hypothetical protein
MAATTAYSRPVSRASNPIPWSPRVYYIIAGAIALVLWAGAGAAQPDLTVAPGMVKGALDAPVTIVEFSDYQ